MKVTTFEIEPEELAKAQGFVSAHRELHAHESEGAIGGRFTWSFTPTSIGTIVVIRCACGESLDVTNYGDW